MNKNVKNCKELFVNLDVCDGQLEVNGVVFVKDTPSNGLKSTTQISFPENAFSKILSFWKGLFNPWKLKFLSLNRQIFVSLSEAFWLVYRTGS